MFCKTWFILQLIIFDFIVQTFLSLLYYWLGENYFQAKSIKGYINIFHFLIILYPGLDFCESMFATQISY